MQRIARLKLFLFSLLMFFALIVAITPRTINAQENFSSGNTPMLQKGKTINEDYFAAGETVTVSGTVNGDVYAAGGNVLVDGTVNGDVLAAGGNVTVNGKVTGNIRAAGGQVVIGADVGKNVTLAGGSLVIEDGAKIAGSLTAGGGSLSVLVPIGKSVTFGGNNLRLASAIGGNVNAALQRLDSTDSTKIAGSLNYWSNNKAQIPNSVAVKGITYHHTNYNTPQKQQNKGILNGFSFIWEFLSLVSAFIVGILLIWLLPLYMRNMTVTILTRLGGSFLAGFVAVIVIPVAFLVLLITLVGIPLAFILLGALFIFTFFNKIFISYAIGKKILPEKTVVALLVGLVIYGIVSVIPIVGGIWGFVSFCVGLGAFLLMKRDLYAQARAKKLL